MSKRTHNKNGPIGSWQKAVMLKQIDPEFSSDDIFNIACKVGKVDTIKWIRLPPYIHLEKRARHDFVYQRAVITFGEHDEAAKFINKFDGRTDFSRHGHKNFVNWDKLEKREPDIREAKYGKHDKESVREEEYSDDNYSDDESYIRDDTPADRYIEDIFLKIKYVEVQQRRISNAALKDYSENWWLEFLSALEDIRWSHSLKFSDGQKFKLYFDHGVRSERNIEPIHEVKARFLNCTATGTGVTKINAKYFAGKQLICNLLARDTDRLIAELLDVDVVSVVSRITTLKRNITSEKISSSDTISPNSQTSKVIQKLETEHRSKVEVLQTKLNKFEQEKLNFELENVNLLTDHSSNLIKLQDALNKQEKQACEINEISKNLETCETELKNERDHNAQNVVKLKSQNTLLASKDRSVFRDIKFEAENDACDSKRKKQYKSFGCQVGSTFDPDESVFNPNQECVDVESAKKASEKEEELNSRIEFWEEENKKLVWKHSKEQMELNFQIRKYKKSEQHFESQAIQMKTVQSDLMKKECELESYKGRIEEYENEFSLADKALEKLRTNKHDLVTKIVDLETLLKKKSDELKTVFQHERKKILGFCKNIFSDGFDKISSLEIEADSTPEVIKPVSNDLNNNVANMPTDLGDGETMTLTKNRDRKFKQETDN